MMKQKELIDTEAEFFVCDSSNIDDYLYEMATNHSSLQAAKQFDFIDLVFIEGDANLRPWSKKAKKFIGLIKNCLKSKKPLWCSSFGMQALVYLSATNMEKYPNVINGNNGGSIDDLKKLQIQPDNVGMHNLFLDNITGDLYQFNMLSQEWHPLCNVGMHFRKKAQENQTYGKIIMGHEIYRPNTKHDKTMSLFEAKINETVCFIRKVDVQHWLFKDLTQFEFLVPSKNSWDVHLINFPNKQIKFDILADSKFTAQIIEINDWTIGNQFCVNNKYHETEIILKNFIIHQLHRIRDGSRSIPIMEAQYINLSGKQENNREIQSLQQKQQFEKQTQEATINCYRDSIFSSQYQSQKNTQQFQNNSQEKLTKYQTQNSVQMAENMLSEFQSKFNSNNNRPNTAFSRPQTGLTRPFTAKTQKTIKSVSDIKGGDFNNRLFSGKSRESLQQNTQFYNYCQDLMYQHQMNVNNNTKDQNNNNNYYSSNVQNSNNNTSSVENVTENLALMRNLTMQQREQLQLFDHQIGDKKLLKNKTEIRLLLHPQIGKDGLPEKDTIWIPGQRSCKNLGISSKWTAKLNPSTSKAIKIPTGKKINFGTTDLRDEVIKQDLLLKHSFRQRPQSGMQSKFIPNYDLCREKPYIRCSGPYATKEELEQDQQRINDTKIIANRVIKVKPPEQQYVQGLQNQPNIDLNKTAQHQFRSVQKQKWVSDNNFKLAV